MKANLIFGAAGVILGALLYHFLLAPEFESRVEVLTTTETKIDWVKKDTTIINYRDSLVLKIVKTEASPEPEKYDSIRTYRGSVPSLYGLINWKARTGGELQQIEFNPVFSIPVKTISTTTETKSQKVERPKGLFITGGVRSDQDFAAGALYLRDRSVFSYDYFVGSKTHFVKVGFNPFKK